MNRSFVATTILLAVAASTALAANGPERFASVKTWSGRMRCKYNVERKADWGASVTTSGSSVVGDVNLHRNLDLRFRLDPSSAHTPQQPSWTGPLTTTSGDLNELGNVYVEGKEVERKTLMSLTLMPSESPEMADLDIDVASGTFDLWVRAPRFDAKAEYFSIGTSGGLEKQGAGNEEVGWDLKKLERQRLPATGMAIRGTHRYREPILPPAGMPVEDEILCEYELQPGPAAPEVRLDGEECTCSTEGYVSLTLVGPGKVKKWEVTPVGALPAASVSRKGEREIRLQGNAKVTGRTQVVAEVEDGKIITRTPPKLVSFCKLSEPVLTHSTYSVTGVADGYMFDRKKNDLELSFNPKEQWLNGESAVDRMEWKLERDDEGLFKLEKTKGTLLKLVASKLPLRNEAFGKNAIKGTLDAEGCREETKPLKVTLFYALGSKGHPGPGSGTTPNWFHYWSQTRAGEPARRAGVVEYHKILPAPASGQADAAEFARYEISVDKVYLSRNVGWGECRPRPPEQGGTKDWGIDCFAITVRHELQHRAELTAWWTPSRRRLCPVIGNICAADNDGDLVPNEVEATLKGCLMDLPWSCPGRPTHFTVKDVEMNAYNVGWQWVSGAANDEDWACPGKQCDDNSGNEYDR